MGLFCLDFIVLYMVCLCLACFGGFCLSVLVCLCIGYYGICFVIAPLLCVYYCVLLV